MQKVNHKTALDSSTVTVTGCTLLWWLTCLLHITVYYNSQGMGFQVEWKLVALSAPYRLKRPDRRFEELKNYTTELQTHINNIIKIRTVSPAISSGQSKGERGGTTFPHLLLLVYTVPPPEFEGYALAS